LEVNTIQKDNIFTSSGFVFSSKNFPRLKNKKPCKALILLALQGFLYSKVVLGARGRNRTGTPAINEAADFKSNAISFYFK